MSHCLAPLLSFRPTERSEGSRGINAKHSLFFRFQANRFALIPESAGINRRSVVNERVIR
jgi:hypothetical protein